MTHRKGALRAFSLLEVGVALMLIGTLIAVAIPTLNGLVGVELKRSTGMLQGLMRDTYARAALTGDAHRIVFDLENNTYWVERTNGNAVAPRKLFELNREGAAVLTFEDERLERIDPSTQDLGEQTKRELLGVPTWEKVASPGEDDTEELRPQLLPSACREGERDGCVRFLQVWVDHMTDPARGGQASLTFYPGGFTQQALITLTDEEEGERVFTLEVEPLTAAVYITDDLRPIPEVER